MSESNDLETERRYRRTLDSLLEGFQIVAKDWTYLYVNPSAARHGQRSADQLVGRRMGDAYPGIEATPLFATLERCMQTRTSCSLENDFVLPDGTTRCFELRIDPVPEGLCIHSVDVQARKDAEMALRRTNQQLEHRVADRTRQLEAANRELEAFAYSVSHDLRAPVRHVQGFLALLHREAGASLNEAGQRRLRTISDAAARMNRLIEDLLGFSRLGQARLSCQRTSLDEVVREAIAELGHAHEGRHIEWAIGPLPAVWGDRSLLRIAFVNLIGNAIKYTQRRTMARIEIGADPSTDGEAIVFVKDNGAGFDMHYASKLFGVFQRLHSADDFEGTGIGLANVQRIVHRHGGRVWATGAVDVGATVHIAVPKEPPDA
ncbi:MAG: sensor histidine kinase [Vicinamibacterales bacterium]